MSRIVLMTRQACAAQKAQNMKANEEDIKAEIKTSVTVPEGKRPSRKTVAPVDAKIEAPEEKSQNASKGKLGSLLGHSVVSVIRCLGKNGWTFDHAEEALKKAGIAAATHTIKIGLKRGRDGQKRIAPLSAEELETLRIGPAKKKAKRGAQVPSAEAQVAA
jgi:hypothetical protein